MGNIFNSRNFQYAAGSTSRRKAASSFKRPDPIDYLAEDVFAAAAAAAEINIINIKSAYIDVNGVQVDANKSIAMKLLKDPTQIKPEHRAIGEVIRAHYQLKIFQQLSNDAISGFLQGAIECANRNTISSIEFLQFGIALSLPYCYKRDVVIEKAREIKQELARISFPLGVVGMKVSGEFEVIESYFSVKFGVYAINAKMGNNMVFFFFKSSFESGQIIKLTGTIKAIRDNTVTQLNRVKVTFIKGDRAKESA